MRIRMLPFLFIGFMFILLAILLLVAASHVHANPAIVVAPNGQITVIYQGTNGQPSTVIPPTGVPLYVFPQGSAPVSVVPYPTYTPPPIAPSLPMVLP